MTLVKSEQLRGFFGRYNGHCVELDPEAKEHIKQQFTDGEIVIVLNAEDFHIWFTKLKQKDMEMQEILHSHE